MLMNEMLNAAEQLNLLKLIFDNTWRALIQQAGAGYSKPKRGVSRTVSRTVSRSTSKAKHKTQHHKPAKPVMVPVQPLPKPQIQPQAVLTKPKPFNTPKGQTYSSRPAQPQNRAFDSKSQNAISSADSMQVGRVGIASRNTNTE